MNCETLLPPSGTGLEVVVRSPGEVERTERMVGMIDRQSRLLVKLIDDLMDVSRIATGKVVLQKTRLDLRAVLEAVLEGGQTILDASRHEIRLDLRQGPYGLLAMPRGRRKSSATCSATPASTRQTAAESRSL